MAEIEQIVGKEAIKGFYDLNAGIQTSNQSLMQMLETVRLSQEVLNKSNVTWKELKEVQKQTQEQAKKLTEEEKEQAATLKALDAQRQKAYQKMFQDEQKAVQEKEKLIQKEKEHQAALALEVKTIADAERQNKALRQEVKQLANEHGQNSAKISELNGRINKNTEFIRQNSDAAKQQAMNIGNYKSALQGVWTKLVAFTGALGASIGAMQAFKAIISSTQVTADKFDQVVSGLRTGFTFLANHIATLDFSNLIKGFRDAYQAGVQYAKLMDEIGDQKRSKQIRNLEIEGEIIKLEGLARLNKNDLDQRKYYVGEIKRLEIEKLTNTQDIANQELQAKLDLASKNSGMDQKEIEDFIRHYNLYSARITEGMALSERLNKIKDDQQRTAYASAKAGITTVDSYAAAFAALTETEKENLRLFEQTNKIVDKGIASRDDLANAINEVQRANNEYETGIKSLSRIENRIFSEEEKIANKQGSNADDATERHNKYLDELEKEYQAYLKLQQEKAAALAAFNNLAQQYRTEEQSEDDLALESKADYYRSLVEFARQAFEQTSEGQKRAYEQQLIDLKAARDAGLLTEKEYQSAVQELEEETKQVRLDALNAVAESVQQIGNALYETRLMEIQGELDANNAARDEELAKWEGNKEMQASINAKYDAEERKLKRKQAEDQKKQALFNAWINLASAILSAATTAPFIPLGLIAMATAAILGGIQIAAIQSQPIPQFYKGTESAPDGVISVAEKGHELVTTKSGKTLLVNEPSIMSGLKGARIYSKEETDTILASGRGGYDSKELRNTLDRNNDRLIRTIINKKEIHINARTREISERSGGHWTHYKNRYFE